MHTCNAIMVVSGYDSNASMSPPKIFKQNKAQTMSLLGFRDASTDLANENFARRLLYTYAMQSNIFYSWPLMSLHLILFDIATECIALVYACCFLKA